MSARTLVILEGDQNGQELLEEALRVIDPNLTGLDLEFERFDLSLENRRSTQNQCVYEAAEAMRKHGLGLKAATITPSGKDDVSSPNRILREEIGAEVILRTGRRIPGVRPIAGSESMVISLGEGGRVASVMAETPHGTAPTLEGRNVANLMAMKLGAAGSLAAASPFAGLLLVRRRQR